MKPKEEDQADESVNSLFDEDAFGQLGVNYGLRQAFMRKEPMSQGEYEGIYVYGGGAAAYFMAPPYEEYLKLFKKYRPYGYSDPDFYIQNIMGQYQTPGMIEEARQFWQEALTTHPDEMKPAVERQENRIGRNNVHVVENNV